MKKILFLFVFTVFCKFLSAQKVRDSILVARDTIHVYGKVVDKLGHPVSGALVLSETLDENYNYVRTKTDEFGNLPSLALILTMFYESDERASQPRHR